MCTIIDTNKIGSLLKNPKARNTKPVYNWLKKGGVLIYPTDGKFAEELGNLDSKA